MATDRTTLIRGPGAVQYGTTVLHDANGIQADIQVATNPVATSLYGEIDQWINNRFGTISFTPAGEVTTAILAALYPHQTLSIGDSIFGDTDTALIVHSKAGTKVTYHCAALTQPPQLRLSATQVAFGGAAQFRAILAKNKDPADSGALYTVAAAAYSAATYPFAADTLVRGAYSGDWDGTTIIPRAGWTIDVQLNTEPITTDHDGEIDIILTGITVTARCEPQNLTEATLATLIPYTAAQGSSIRAGKALTITAGAGTITATLTDARPIVGPLQWGTTTLRAGELAFIAQRSLTGATPGDLYSIALTPKQGED